MLINHIIIASKKTIRVEWVPTTGTTTTTTHYNVPENISAWVDTPLLSDYGKTPACTYTSRHALFSTHTSDTTPYEYNQSRIDKYARNQKGHVFALWVYVYITYTARLSTPC